MTTAADRESPAGRPPARFHRFPSQRRQPNRCRVPLALLAGPQPVRVSSDRSPAPRLDQRALRRPCRPCQPSRARAHTHTHTQQPGPLDSAARSTDGILATRIGVAATTTPRRPLSRRAAAVAVAEPVQFERIVRVGADSDDELTSGGRDSDRDAGIRIPRTRVGGGSSGGHGGWLCAAAAAIQVLAPQAPGKEPRPSPYTHHTPQERTRVVSLPGKDPSPCTPGRSPRPGQPFGGTRGSNPGRAVRPCTAEPN